MRSSRLPGKVLKKIEGISVLEHIVHRLNASRILDDIVVATSNEKADKQILQLAKKKAWKSFAGSEVDVLGRFADAAKAYEAEVIVRVCADCVFYDSQVMDRVLKCFFNEDCDYATTTIHRSFPRGIAVEVLNSKTLEIMNNVVKKKNDREHVTSFIIENSEKFKIYKYIDQTGLYNPNWRWVLDTQKDFEFAKEVYSYFYRKKPLFGIEDIRKWTLEHQDKIIYNQQVYSSEQFI